MRITLTEALPRTPGAASSRNICFVDRRPPDDSSSWFTEAWISPSSMLIYGWSSGRFRTQDRALRAFSILFADTSHRGDSMMKGMEMSNRPAGTNWMATGMCHCMLLSGEMLRFTP